MTLMQNGIESVNHAIPVLYSPLRVVYLTKILAGSHLRPRHAHTLTD